MGKLSNKLLNFSMLCFNLNNGFDKSIVVFHTESYLLVFNMYNSCLCKHLYVELAPNVKYDKVLDWFDVWHSELRTLSFFNLFECMQCEFRTVYVPRTVSVNSK